MIKFNKNNKLIKIHQKINKTKLKFPKKFNNYFKNMACIKKCIINKKKKI